MTEGHWCEVITVLGVSTATCRTCGWSTSTISGEDQAFKLWYRWHPTVPVEEAE